MPRKRKQNAGLSVKKKSYRYRKVDKAYVCNEINRSILNNDDNSVNSDNGNTDNVIISNSNSSSSNYNNSNVLTIDNETTTNIISDNEDIHDEDAPIVEIDFMMEMKLLKQMKQESHRWSVFNLFIFKYNGLSPPDNLDLYQYWIGRSGIASRIKRDLHLPRTYCVKDRMLPIFERILDCFKLGVKFHPNSVDNRGGNRKMTIRLDSYEA